VEQKGGSSRSPLPHPRLLPTFSKVKKSILDGPGKEHRLLKIFLKMMNYILASM
jgi:hypothetical protein